MRLAIVIDGVIDKVGTPQQLFPNVSFRRGVVPDSEFLDENNAVVVDTAWMPPIDQTTQRFEETDPYINENGDVVVWSAVTLNAGELQQKAEEPYYAADYEQFWQELVRSQVYTTLRDAAKVDLAANVLATELISIFSDAKNGKLDIEVMQTGIWEVVGALNAIDPALVTALSAMMSTHGLQVYTLTPPAE